MASIYSTASATRPAHVRLSGLCKSYDGAAFVVRDLDLTVGKGEFVSLLGPSGSGKTTTLMMLAGFEFPSSGEISVDGRPVGGLPPEKRNIGMVFQNYALFPHMTVAENVGYSLRVRRLGKAAVAARVEAALASVRLSAFAGRRPAALSGGQQQRVALARALIFEPALVLMDEPLGALDKRLREELQIEIRQIGQRLGLTIVYVTHDQHEALTMSDRIAIFNDGRIQQIGSAQDIYNRPENRFVADFVGDNNCLDAEVLGIEAGVAEVRLAGGQRARATATPHAAAGGRATVAVRPESIGLTAPDAPDAVTGRLCDIIYCGDQFRLHVALPDGPRLVVKTPAAPAGLGAAVGDAVALRWRPDQAWALDARQAA